MKKTLVALVCVMSLLGLGACGSHDSSDVGSPSPDNTSSKSAAPAESESPTATPSPTERVYTDNDMRNAMNNCNPMSQPGADFLQLQDRPGGVTLALTTFGLRGKGMDSNVYRCVFNSLTIPDGLAMAIASPQGVKRESTTSNLNVLWTTDYDGSIELYMSTEPINQ